MKNDSKQASAKEIAIDDDVQHDYTLLTEDDIFLFNEGNHFRLYEKLGAHVVSEGQRRGTYFALWAPNAAQVNVMGDFNEWNRDRHRLRPRGQSGIWEGFVPGLGQGAVYKYHIQSRQNNYQVDKADPFAFFNQIAPEKASVVWERRYAWQDQEWMAQREHQNALESPLSIYELHLGSWRRMPEEDNRFLTYRELAPLLAEYIQHMGFSHVEFLPLMEHPFYGSWGYQTLGYFSPTSRFGTPQDLMYLMDYLHQHGIGVILDWVPSHFPTDEHGLGFFDGTHLFEHADSRKGFHPDWQSSIFNYGRNEVRSFLISSALFWHDVYHIDGLRVDAVASMLYLDYSRKQGEWIPNLYGGNENLEAIDFLRRFNEAVHQNYPRTVTIAEESTAWPMVSRPTYLGGLGFDMKWDMGWMHDTLQYMSREPVHRAYHHDKLTFRMLYAFAENYVLPLSHDEVVHGKGSLLGKMSGDDWQKFANLKVLLGYMYAQPGKKLLFMGAELGQWAEWSHDRSLDWHLLDYPPHSGIQRWVHDLNQVYRREPALHQLDFAAESFSWIDCSDALQSTISLMRRSRTRDDALLVACNFTPVPRHNYRIGAPQSGSWQEILNSDSQYYGGSGQGSLGAVEAAPVPSHGLPYSLNLTLPPLAAVFLKRKEAEA